MNVELIAMNAENTGEVVALISDAMNPSEGGWAKNTINFHFFCKKNGVDDGRKYFVAKIEDEIVGITGLHNYNWGPADIVWLGWFAVSPKYQGQKIGYKLMRETVQLAKKLNYRKIFIETYSDDGFAKARNFYEKFGFCEDGHIASYIDDKTNMVVFGLNLYD